MSADRFARACVLAASCAASAACAQTASLGELTIGRLAAMQRQLMEQELARKFSANTPDAGAARPASPAASTSQPVAVTAPAPRTITLLGLVAIQGAVRHAELLHDGAVVAAHKGQMLSGWKLTTVTPQEVRLARGRTNVVLKPGDSMEVR